MRSVAHRPLVLTLRSVGEKKKSAKFQIFLKCGNFMRALIPNHSLLGGKRLDLRLTTDDDNEQ
jgi:hypothetical protein